VNDTAAPPRTAARRARAAAPPFVDDYLPALLAQASQLVSCEFHEIVKASGWTVTEWRIMATLAGGRALSTGELSRVSLTKQPTVTRVLHGLQERGEVERIDDASDRRVTLVRMTAAGERAVARLIAQARAHESATLAPFGEALATELKRALRRIIDEHTPAGRHA